MEPQLLHHVGDGVATVVIHHPAKRNAMTTGMWRALPPLLDELTVRADVHALVLTGEGGTFCAGADISTLRGSPDEAQGLAVLAEESLAAFPKPTLAAIRGYCVGGGSQLAAACDLRFAQEGSLFGVTPAKLGIVYPASSTRRLAALVGPSAAKYLLFSGELIDAERALRTGLVDEVLPEGELDKRVAEFTRILASRSCSRRRLRRSSRTGAPTVTRTGRNRRAAAATPRRGSPPSWSAGSRASPGPREDLTAVRGTALRARVRRAVRTPTSE